MKSELAIAACILSASFGCGSGHSPSEPQVDSRLLQRPALNLRVTSAAQLQDLDAEPRRASEVYLQDVAAAGGSRLGRGLSLTIRELRGVVLGAQRVYLLAAEDETGRGAAASQLFAPHEGAMFVLIGFDDTALFGCETAGWLEAESAMRARPVELERAQNLRQRHCRRLGEISLASLIELQGTERMEDELQTLLELVLLSVHHSAVHASFQVNFPGEPHIRGQQELTPLSIRDTPSGFEARGTVLLEGHLGTWEMANHTLTITPTEMSHDLDDGMYGVAVGDILDAGGPPIRLIPAAELQPRITAEMRTQIIGGIEDAGRHEIVVSPPAKALLARTSIHWFREAGYRTRFDSQSRQMVQQFEGATSATIAYALGFRSGDTLPEGLLSLTLFLLDPAAQEATIAIVRDGNPIRLHLRLATPH